jgi:hypothetical protein
MAGDLVAASEQVVAKFAIHLVTTSLCDLGCPELGT